MSQAVFQTSSLRTVTQALAWVIMTQKGAIASPGGNVGSRSGGAALHRAQRPEDETQTLRLWFGGGEQKQKVC